MEPMSNYVPKRTLLVVDGSYLLISAQKMKLNINYIKLVHELERALGCEVGGLSNTMCNICG